MPSSFDTQSRRRRFLKQSMGLAAPALIGLPSRAAAEPPPETRTIRLEDFPAICLAPQLLAEELLHAEGFTQVEYARSVANIVSEDQYDLTMITAPALIASQDRSTSFVAIAGVHAGCQELFGNERVPAIRHLKGKSVAISALGAGEHVFVSSVAAYVGIDPKRDIDWVVAGSSKDALKRFVEGKADAFLGFEPQPHELRARSIGQVILNTSEDRPWSQYFCCMLAARREFTQRYPIATKRALRALMKATDLCAQQPEHAARHLVERGHEPRYDVALRVLQRLPFDRWRDTNPEDTLRFYALRLHEGGVIQTSPNRLIAQSTDWRFLNELKRELKS